ncbi:hypothetical protein [Paramesorhizobium deserti]|uniref:hypothetical protein n=1 Tax=Paramesorhizobium deserti TaxID=1494590 RepID=UPI001379A440|nr:hypothetical protein [Paramesorhizobium deserti]
MKAECLYLQAFGIHDYLWLFSAMGGFYENGSHSACRIGIHFIRARTRRRLSEKLAAWLFSAMGGFYENGSHSACRIGIHFIRARTRRRLSEKLAARSMLPYGQQHWHSSLPLSSGPRTDITLPPDER